MTYRILSKFIGFLRVLLSSAVVAFRFPTFFGTPFCQSASAEVLHKASDSYSNHRKTRNATSSVMGQNKAYKTSKVSNLPIFMNLGVNLANTHVYSVQLRPGSCFSSTSFEAKTWLPESERLIKYNKTMNHIYPEYIRKWKRLEYVGMTCSSPLGALALHYMSWFTYPKDSNSQAQDQRYQSSPPKASPRDLPFFVHQLELQVMSFQIFLSQQQMQPQIQVFEHL